MTPITTLIFDWGDTVMPDNPDKREPMVLWEEVRLVPDIADALTQLHTTYTLCIASNARDSNAEQMCEALERVRIRHLFHYAYTSRELGASKPNPLFFEALLTGIGRTAAECIMIGNDPEKDITGAKAIGMKAIWYRPSSAVYRTTGIKAADATISSMKELMPTIQHISAGCG